MGVRTRNISKNAAVGKECVQLALGTSALSQTGKRTDSVTIPYPFVVTRVEIYSLTVTATITVDVQIGTTSVLASVVTPVADTPTAGTLSATVANTQSTATTGTINLFYTSNGSGAATNLYASVWIRPLGMDGDVSPTTA